MTQYITLPGTPFKESAGVQINITEEGKFVAIVGGKLLSKASIRDLERDISKLSLTVKVFSIGHFHISEIEEITDVVTRNDGYYKSTKYRVRGVGPLKTLYDCYVYDKAVYDYLVSMTKEYEAKRKELDNEYSMLFDETKKSLHRVHPELVSSLLSVARGEVEKEDGKEEDPA